MTTRLYVALQSRLVAREEGASLVEYALLLALVALVAIAAVRIVGTNVSDDFQSIADSL
jgi:pilus assembly protein Flp/PilA